MLFPNFAVSRSTKEVKPIKPKNMEKSFQPPIKLEVLDGNMLKGIMLIPKIRWKNWKAKAIKAEKNSNK